MKPTLGLLGLLLVSGCPEPPPPVPLDTPARDAGPALDADLDAAGLDAPGLDAPGIDADLDAAGMDAPGGDPDGSIPDDGATDDAPDGPKDVGPLEDGGELDGAFVTCTDSRECRRGYACEAGNCVDRRVHCGLVGDCPFGFFCDSTTGVEPYFCARLLRPCASTAECLAGICADVDGDGDSECVASGTCDTRSDCAAGMTCETLPIELFAQCGSYGACTSAADCGSGRLCVDLWGDGVRECVDAGGCSSTASCPGSGICATPPSGGPPVCLSRPLP